MACHVAKGKCKECRPEMLLTAASWAGIRPRLHAVPHSLQCHAFHKMANNDSKTSEMLQSLAVRLCTIAGLHIQLQVYSDAAQECNMCNNSDTSKTQCTHDALWGRRGKEVLLAMKAVQMQ